MNRSDRTTNKKRIIFTFHAPGAKSVHIAGSFNDWDMHSDPLSQGKTGRIEGIWRRVFYLEPGVYEYRFVVDGIWHDDPDATELWTNEFGSYNCVVWV